MRYLLMIDSSGRLELGNVGNGARVPIGELAGPSAKARATSVVWSPEGQWTAWSADSIAPDGVHQLRIHHEAANTTEVLADALTAFYLCPSPDGRYLSHLSPGPLGLELAVSDVHSGELQIVERGQPLFWAWSPEADRLAVHVEDRVVVAELGGGESTLVTQQAGSFSAPSWMPGGSVAMVIDGQIVCGGPDRALTTLVERAGAEQFALGPDGRRVALVDQVDGRTCLVVRDLMSGAIEEVTSKRTTAFHWSPDGRRLAALVLASDSELQWVVHDGSEVIELQAFRPGRTWLRNVVPFFGQYAHSHSVWSADGTQLVAPALDDDGSGCALVQGIEPPFTSHRLPNVELVWWANE